MTAILTVEARTVEHVLNEIEFKLSLAPLMGWMKEAVEPMIAKRAINRFHNEGDDASGPWAPLAQATQIERSALGYGASHPINVRTGELEHYITQSSGDVTGVEDSAVLFYPGGETPIGETQDLESKIRTAQLGGPFGANGRAPARPVLALSETDVADVHLSLEEYIFGFSARSL